MTLGRLVLDTNLYSFGGRGALAALVARGFKLSVSEIAFTEALARSVRHFKSGESRQQARGRFFNRARSLAHIIDDQHPIALAAGHAVERIAARADGNPCVETDEYEAHVRDVWRTVVGVGLTDEEWIAAGEVANQWLDELDAHLADLALPEAQLRARPIVEDVDGERMTEEQLAEAYAEWDATDEAQKLASIRAYLRRTWNLSDAASDRLDAQIHGLAWRLNESAHGRWRPGGNDGADLRLAVHVGEDVILLTNDEPLVGIIDACGTYQAPWVRRLSDLDGQLPEGPPWGDYARDFAATWKRSTKTNAK
jgi:hypothetical protein